MNDLGKYLFDSIVCMNKAYLEQLPCNCEEMVDEMRASWTCPRHGYREPNYDIINRGDYGHHERATTV
jgi:hypothetical protein